LKGSQGDGQGGKIGVDQGEEGGATRCLKMIVFEDNGVMMVVKGSIVRMQLDVRLDGVVIGVM
jgi:hypothetical protein